MNRYLSNRKSIEVRAGQVAKEIRVHLQKVGLCSSSEDDISTDLGDIGEVCQKYLSSLDVLFHQIDKDEALGVLNQIQNDLYIHLAYHFKQLRMPLRQAIRQLETGKRKNKKSIFQIQPTLSSEPVPPPAPQKARGASSRQALSRKGRL